MCEKNLLKIRKMGMDFYEGDARTANSDCGNFRLRVEDITTNDGVTFGADFNFGVKYAFTDEKGRELKKPKIISVTHLHADAWTEKLLPDGFFGCVHYTEFEQAAWHGDYRYTLADILALVNKFSRVQYTAIEFIN